MKNFILICMVTAFSLLSVANAQTNRLAKTTWELEKRNTDGSIVFKKAKPIKFPDEQGKFNFLQFEADKNYHTGNSCFHMMGNYNVYTDGQVEISEGIADMSSDCKEPKAISGTYDFKIDKGLLTLTPVKN